MKFWNFQFKCLFPASIIDGTIRVRDFWRCDMVRMCGLQECEWIVFGNILLVEREVSMGGWGTIDMHVIDGGCQGYNLLL